MTKGLVVLGQPEQKKERADAQHNRVRILEAARKLMKKRTLDHLCMDELAAVAGVGKGTLYRRFEDKQALLHALLDDDERALQESVKKTFARDRARPQESLVALLEELHAFSLEHVSVLSAAEASARGRHLASPPYLWRHAVVVDLLERAGVATRSGAHHVADALLSSMSGEVLARALEGLSPAAVQAQAAAYFRAVCQGLRA
jgi:AcrR family transcriptional regulator